MYIALCVNKESTINNPNNYTPLLIIYRIQEYHIEEKVESECSEEDEVSHQSPQFIFTKYQIRVEVDLKRRNNFKLLKKKISVDYFFLYRVYKTERKNTIDETDIEFTYVHADQWFSNLKKNCAAAPLIFLKRFSVP